MYGNGGAKPHTPMLYQPENMFIILALSRSGPGASWFYGGPKRTHTLHVFLYCVTLQNRYVGVGNSRGTCRPDLILSGLPAEEVEESGQDEGF